MNLIFAILCLTIINKSDCYERTFAGCKGSQDIYLQYYPPISGWYKRNLSNKNEYVRILPNVTELSRYEFLLDGGEWNVNLWTKAWSKGIVYSKKDEEMISYLPKSLNTKRPNPPFSLSRRKRSGKRQGISNKLSNKNKNKTAAKETLTKTSFEADGNQDMKDQTMSTDGVPAFNVYCPGRCRCTRAVAMDSVFTRFDVTDSETKNACWERIETATELPEENKEFLRKKYTNQSMTTYDEHNDIDYDETYPEFVKRHETNKWKPELYVSKDCDVLYYNKLYDTWIVDFEWEEKNCYSSFSSDAGIQNYVSNNSAPCVEYLPVARYQQWSNPQPYYVDSDEPDDFIEHCERNFTLKPNKIFNVTCLEFDQK